MKSEVLKRNDIAIITNLGNIVVLDIPLFVEIAAQTTDKFSLSWIQGLNIVDFIIAPRYKIRLNKLYGKTAATQIYNRIELALVGCKISSKSTLQETDRFEDFDL